MATAHVTGTEPAKSHRTEGGSESVESHYNAALEIAREASFRIEGMAKILMRELERREAGYGAQRIARDLVSLNSVVMTVLCRDGIARLSHLAEVVGVEVPGDDKEGSHV